MPRFCYMQDMPYGSFYDLKKKGAKDKAATHKEFMVAVKCAYLFRRATWTHHVLHMLILDAALH